MTTLELVTRLLAALLSFYHHGIRIERIRTHQEVAIQRIVDAVEAHPEVPAALSMSVGFLETALGFDHGEGGCLGSPIDRRHRHVSGGSSAQTRDLLHSYQTCGDWMHALHRYRVGDCNGRERIGYTAEQALQLAERLSSAINEPLPVNWRHVEEAHDGFTLVAHAPAHPQESQ